MSSLSTRRPAEASNNALSLIYWASLRDGWVTRPPRRARTAARCIWKTYGAWAERQQAELWAWSVRWHRWPFLVLAKASQLCAHCLPFEATETSGEIHGYHMAKNWLTEDLDSIVAHYLGNPVTVVIFAHQRMLSPFLSHLIGSTVLTDRDPWRRNVVTSLCNLCERRTTVRLHQQRLSCYLSLNLFPIALRSIAGWPFSLWPPLTEPLLRFVAVKIQWINRRWCCLARPSARSAAPGLEPTSQRLTTSRQWSKAQKGACDANTGETKVGSMRQHRLTIRFRGARHHLPSHRGQQVGEIVSFVSQRSSVNRQLALRVSVLV